MGFLIGFFSIILFLLCGFIVLVVLMQRPSANAGMGAALGGGAAESAFGGESTNVLTRWTIYAAVAFFVICFGLYMAYMSRMSNDAEVKSSLPEIVAEETAEAAEYVPGALTEVPAEAPAK